MQPDEGSLPDTRSSRSSVPLPTAQVRGHCPVGTLSLVRYFCFRSLRAIGSECPALGFVMQRSRNYIILESKMGKSSAPQGSSAQPQGSLFLIPRCS